MSLLCVPLSLPYTANDQEIDVDSCPRIPTRRLALVKIPTSKSSIDDAVRAATLTAEFVVTRNGRDHEDEMPVAKYASLGIFGDTGSSCASISRNRRFPVCVTLPPCASSLLTG